MMRGTRRRSIGRRESEVGNRVSMSSHTHGNTELQTQAFSHGNKSAQTITEEPKKIACMSVTLWFKIHIAYFL